MKAKYVEERYQPWMVFGWNRESGTYDVATVDGDVGTAINEAHATQLVEAHNGVVTALADLAHAFHKADPEAFKRHWYGNS